MMRLQRRGNAQCKGVNASKNCSDGYTTDAIAKSRAIEVAGRNFKFRENFKQNFKISRPLLVGLSHRCSIHRHFVVFTFIWGIR